jgi:hypothetical protein
VLWRSWTPSMIKLITSVEQQDGLVQTREGTCVPHKLCNIGETAMYAGQQVDAIAILCIR